MNDGIDIGDLQEGFQVGKSIKIAEWSWRKEQREFKKLVDRLRSSKWWREVKAERGERYERKLEQCRAQNKKPERRKKLNEQQNARRLAAFVAKGEMLRCPECGATWPKPRRIGPHKKYCTPKCSGKAYRREHRDEIKARHRDYLASRKQSKHKPAGTEDAGS